MKMTERQDRLGRAQAADELGLAVERHLGELLTQKPERITWKIQYLISRWQLDDAWSLLDPAWSSASAPEVAAVLVSLLQKSREDQRQYARVKDHLDKALGTDPDSLSLIMSSATIAQLCGEYDLCIALYRAALDKNPEIISAMNELAVLYSLRNNRSDHHFALKLIDEAIRLAGPLHFLLDTKATVLLALDKPRLAIDLLNQAIADTPSSAKTFHLMQAYLELDQIPEAKSAYRTAMAEGFHISKLHPLEQSLAQSIMKDLGK
jgi:tetratricopeptide (TPR) repeat protein